MKTAATLALLVALSGPAVAQNQGMTVIYTGSPKVDVLKPGSQKKVILLTGTVCITQDDNNANPGQESVTIVCPTVVAPRGGADSGPVVQHVFQGVPAAALRAK